MVIGYILPEEASLSPFSIGGQGSKGQHLQKTICSSRSKCFALRVDQFQRAISSTEANRNSCKLIYLVTIISEKRPGPFIPAERLLVRCLEVNGYDFKRSNCSILMFASLLSEVSLLKERVSARGAKYGLSSKGRTFCGGNCHSWKQQNVINITSF